jgi:DNA-binding response OmpR family regulator
LGNDLKHRHRSYRILVVDDAEENVAILEARLQANHYETISAFDGLDALKKMEEETPDLVLLDVMMPKMDGFEVCQRIKANEDTQMIPVIMVTAKTDVEDIARGFEVGADDYLTKPYQQMELMARVRSMLRIRQAYLDIQELNSNLEEKVKEQVAEIERVGRLKRYFSPQLLQSLTSNEATAIMKSHRREITVVFLDLRGFTAFSERAEPEEVIAVLRELHQTAGSIIFRHEGTIERFTGDGIMVFLGDPMPMEDHPMRSVRMALDLRREVGELSKRWKKMGFDLSLGIGISTGYATLGTIGFEGRLDYAAIGNATNLASRLCDEAEAEQILISHKTKINVEEVFRTKSLGTVPMHGFSKALPIYEVLDSPP